MKCRCGANLAHLNAAGEPMVRNRGLVFKAEGIMLVCPRCREDVPVSGELAKALSVRLLLIRPPT